ncbi:MAG: replication-associated recombination protein A, partial [Desulfobacteria bacterium]
MDLFDHYAKDRLKTEAPLADRMRPHTMDEFVGQDHILKKGKVLRRAIEADEVQSSIFWGPPGTGKTTLAHILAAKTGAHFISFSAVLAGVKEIRGVIEQARNQRRFNNKPTVLFVDEIHRFNKAQQDAFLPHVEDGTITLIGATTENPSFEVISPLLSRTKVFVLNPLKEEELEIILRRALSDKDRGLGNYRANIDPIALKYIAGMADGDARRALNTLELAVMTTVPDKEDTRHITREIVEEVVQRKFLIYDKEGEEHYNLISALHKSMRGSDPDAALYWLGRMLEAGEDPLYIARRLIRFASEDVGNADPHA